MTNISEQKEIALLKKRIENREGTITFLNEIIEAQSKSIDRLKDEIAKLNEKVREYTELQSNFDGYTSLLERQTDKYEKMSLKLINENDELKSKLNVLYKAFNSVYEQPQTEIQEEKSPEKIQHDEELKSKQWKQKREEVFDRYGKQCVECGRKRGIQVHHLVYRKGRHLWEYNTDELIPLCKKCHQKVHEDKNHRFHEKYIS